MQGYADRDGDGNRGRATADREGQRIKGLPLGVFGREGFSQ